MMEWFNALGIVGRIAAVILIVLAGVLLLSFLALHRHARVQRRRVEDLRRQQWDTGTGRVEDRGEPISS